MCFLKGSRFSITAACGFSGTTHSDREPVSGQSRSQPVSEFALSDCGVMLGPDVIDQAARFNEFDLS